MKIMKHIKFEEKSGTIKKQNFFEKKARGSACSPSKKGFKKTKRAPAPARPDRPAGRIARPAGYPARGGI